MAGLIVVGATGASLVRLQGKQKLNDGTRWQHPWFQSFVMFIGETFCLFYYLIEKYLDKRRYGTKGLNPEIIEARKKGLKTEINIFLFAIPASCDCIASAMIYFAYLNMPISVAEMMGGALILITTISSVIFLKKKFFIYQWLSLIIIVGGVSMVGASSIKSDHDEEDSPAIGIALMLVGM